MWWMQVIVQAEAESKTRRHNRRNIQISKYLAKVFRDRGQNEPGWVEGGWEESQSLGTK